MQSSKNLAEDKSIVIKSVDKGSCVVIWDREDYLNEADRLHDDEIYSDVKYTKNVLSSLVNKGEIFQSLSKTNTYQKKNLNFFTYSNKIASDLEKI